MDKIKNFFNEVMCCLTEQEELKISSEELKISNQEELKIESIPELNKIESNPELSRIESIPDPNREGFKIQIVISNQELQKINEELNTKDLSKNIIEEYNVSTIPEETLDDTKDTKIIVVQEDNKDSALDTELVLEGYNDFDTI